MRLRLKPPASIEIERRLIKMRKRIVVPLVFILLVACIPGVALAGPPRIWPTAYVKIDGQYGLVCQDCRRIEVGVLLASPAPAGAEFTAVLPFFSGKSGLDLQSLETSECVEGEWEKGREEGLVYKGKLLCEPSGGFNRIAAYYAPTLAGKYTLNFAFQEKGQNWWERSYQLEVVISKPSIWLPFVSR